jgi:hypothetical protein
MVVVCRLCARNRALCKLIISPIKKNFRFLSCQIRRKRNYECDGDGVRTSVRVVHFLVLGDGDSDESHPAVNVDLANI